MVASLISLTAILIGIISANITGFIFKKYYFGLTANTIIGVFGSVFFMKFFGRLGLKPDLVVYQENVNYFILIGIFLLAAIGAVIALLFSFKFKRFVKNKRFKS